MKQFVVIGAGKFGSSVALALTEKGYQVLLIDNDLDKVQEMSDVVTKAVQVDATDGKAMKALGIKDFDAAIVSIGRQSMEDSIMVTMMLKEMGIGTVVAKALNESHGRILTRMGADKVVFPERDMGIRLANSLVSTSLSDQLDIVPGYSIVEIPAPKEFIGKTIKDAEIRRKHGIQIIAIKSMKPNIDESGESVIEEDLNISPNADTKIGKDDTLLVLGSDKDLQKHKK